MDISRIWVTSIAYHIELKPENNKASMTTTQNAICEAILTFCYHTQVKLCSPNYKLSAHKSTDCGFMEHNLTAFPFMCYHMAKKCDF